MVPRPPPGAGGAATARRSRSKQALRGRIRPARSDRPGGALAPPPPLEAARSQDFPVVLIDPRPRRARSLIAELARSLVQSMTKTIAESKRLKIGKL